MTGTPTKPSISLQQAKSRLESAIERVEHALERRAQVVSGTQSTADHDLQAARAEIRHLRETTATVSARLDATIDKVKVLIDE